MADPGNYRLILGVDLGTSSTKVAAKIHDKNDKVKKQDGPLHVVNLHGRQRQAAIPSCFAYFKGEFLFGADLKQRIALDPSHPYHVPAKFAIEYAKLGFYEAYWKEKGGAVTALKDKLATAGKTLDEAMTDYCKAVFELAIETLCKSEIGASFTPAQLKSMQKYGRISMPQIWSPTARGRVLRAVHEAGIDVVNAASEPQCALAHYLEKLEKTSEANIPINLKKGDFILVADLGCGTGDFVLYEVAEDMYNDLQAVRQANGSLCGSHWVNEGMINQLELSEDGRGLHNAAGSGAMNAEDFNWRLLQAIEKSKTDEHSIPDYSPVTVVGEYGKREFDAMLTRDDFEAAHENPIEAIIGAIDSLIANGPPPKLLLVTGGFRKSEFVQQAIRKKYDRQGETTVIVVEDPDSTMVAEGALSKHYEQIKTQKLPFVYKYAIARDEEADPEVHRDCYYKRYGEDIAVKRKIKPTPYGLANGEQVVIDRLSIILDNEDVRSSQPVSKSQPLRYRPSVEDPEISCTFFYLDSRVRNFRDHDPVWNEKHDAALPWGSNKMREGIHEWLTVKIKLDKDRLAASKCEMHADEGGQMRYHLDADVTIRYKSEVDMTIHWLIKAGEDQWEVSSEVWNGHFSEFSAEHGDVD